MHRLLIKTAEEYQTFKDSYQHEARRRIIDEPLTKSDEEYLELPPKEPSEDSDALADNDNATGKIHIFQRHTIKIRV